MDITNTIRLYAECISGGAITEPTGGSWMSAICIWQGTPTPLNSSYLHSLKQFEFTLFETVHLYTL